jgi:hypothetical protein
MGFFSKAKHFFGGHGVKVEITRLERQDPSAVEFPVTDSVFKGNYTVSSDADVTVTAHRHQFIVIKQAESGTEEQLLGESAHDSSTDIIGGDIKWPYELKAGASVSDSFLIDDIDIPRALRKMGFVDPGAALDDPKLSFVLRVVADVKGSPFDPEAKATVKVVRG